MGFQPSLQVPVSVSGSPVSGEAQVATTPSGPAGWGIVPWGDLPDAAL